MTVSRDEVVWSYRILLGREPESEDVVQLHLRNKEMSTLRESFLRSPEHVRSRSAPYANRNNRTLLPLDLPENAIEYEASAAQMVKCLLKIKSAWSYLGITRPHFSVLTDRSFLPENIAENIEKFWASGEAEAAQVERVLLRYGFTDLAKKTCLEYGCGVGRVTMGLARRFGRLDAYDISPGHLTQAELRGQADGATNIQYHLCSDNFLDELNPCDLFYSRIVFQHNPPPIIHHLVSRALRSVRPNGIAIFQVPTYMVGYRFNIAEWLAADHQPDMQMHCLPQEVVMATIAKENCRLLNLREDNSTGAPDRFISNTFIVRKER
jgi:SAM-dependent methyltransferase